jgi:hypothetical protein
MSEWAQFAHVLDVDDRRTMNAGEDVWAQKSFEFVHRHANGVSFARGVKDNIIVVRFDPGDVILIEEDEASAGTNQEAIHSGLLQSHGIGYEECSDAHRFLPKLLG